MKRMELGMIEQYRIFLLEEEKGPLTVEKYMRDILNFYKYMGEEKEVKKEIVIDYKQHLKETYKLSSANSMIVALNGFLAFFGWNECRVKVFKVQQQIFASKEKELTKEDYQKLVEYAGRNGKERLSLIMQTIASTGIRISELVYITKESIRKGIAEVYGKGKSRQIFLPKELRRALTKYCQRRNIVAGSIFVSKSGKPLDRSNIWTEMKQICKFAHVCADKVFPHNLRHLFARTYYKKKKDIFYLADILGHSNVNTTRIYTSTTWENHSKILSSLGLLC